MTLSTKKRVLLILLACCIQMIYVPTSARISGGIEPRLPIDVLPIWPAWVLPYVLCYFLWAFGIAWMILKMEDRLFRAFSAGCFLTFSLGASIFIFLPTYVEPAVLIGDDVFTRLLTYIHAEWGRYDALPSAHIYITALMALFLNRWYPDRRWIWIAFVIIVSLSTLFTGQHYVADVLGGYLVAFAGYHFGLWRAGLLPAPNRVKRPQLPPIRL